MYAQVLPEIHDDSRSELESSKSVPEPKCLLPDSVHRADGVGPVVDLDEHRGRLLVVTLGINAVVERTGSHRLGLGFAGLPGLGNKAACHPSATTILRSLLGPAQFSPTA